MRDVKIDTLDHKLACILGENGRISVGRVSEQLGITNPTTRSRIARLLRSGVLKIAGLVDPAVAGDIGIAIVGICLERHDEIGDKLHQIADLEKVNWAAVVTGHYDIMTEILLCDEKKDLFDFITTDLGRLGGIRSSESFVIMKARNKWVLPPYSRTYWHSK